MILIAAIVLSAFIAGWKSHATAPSAIEQVVSKETISILTSRQHSSSTSIAQAMGDAKAFVRFDRRLQGGEATAYRLIENLSTAELAKAFAESLSQPRTASGEKLIDFILDCWAQVDPHGAVDACADAFYKDRDRFLNRAHIPLYHLAKTDPNSAMAAWQTHWRPLDRDHDNSSEYALKVVFQHWAERDMEEALSTYQETSLGSASDYAFEGILAQAAHDESQRALALSLVEAMGDPARTRKAHEAVIGHLNVEDAMAWLESQSFPNIQTEPLEEELARRWLRTDQEGASAWLLARSHEGNRPGRIAEMVRLWADWEPNAAGEWLGEMIAQHGAQADQGVARFAREVAIREPAAALEWFGAINDARLREQTAERLASDWAHREMSATVETLIPSSLLTESDQHLIRAHLKRPDLD